ncbi:GNAT family N-acetyltransferase [Oleiagrimonas sp. C23AA]|nr:GNAT family N-acetyltransferase [Oleiagrimonas sp. C23AA]
MPAAAPLDKAPLPPPASRRFAKVQVAPLPRGESVSLPDGRQLTLRPIAPQDVAALQRCFQRLSAEEIRLRFLHPMSQLPEPMARRLCELDDAFEAAFVLMDPSGPQEEMRGVGRIYIDEATNGAEFAVLVEHGWTGRGLGALLMQHLVDECRRRGVDEIWGYVLLENRPMLDLCRHLGFKRRPAVNEPGTTLIALALDETAQA